MLWISGPSRAMPESRRRVIRLPRAEQGKRAVLSGVIARWAGLSVDALIGFLRPRAPCGLGLAFEIGQ
jgi:hypothetical protein